MTRSLPSNQGKVTDEIPAAHSTRRVGHVYLDVRRRKLHCLNETARQLHAEGVPFLPADLAGPHLLDLAGEAVTTARLPLLRAWREEQPVVEDFILAAPGRPAWRVTWDAVPTRSAGGQILGVLAIVTCGLPEPDFRVLAELAHDLRTPLQAITMLAGLLDAPSSADAELQENLRRLRASAQRALEVGRDLLEWSRDPRGRGRPVTRSWFDLEPSLRKLAHELAAEARRKGLALDVDLAAVRGWEIHTDHVRLGRLLSNLLSNAVSYTSAGRVTLTASWRQGVGAEGLVLTVLDTGDGIGAEERQSIFEPLTRGWAGKKSGPGGSGIGLASVNHVLKELGLRLGLESQRGQGSTFNLFVPAALLRRKTADGPPGS